ncbi:hypothetical protein MYX82_03640 [Acidobacteria bacterium AH-259-D05]|nr:hypothetical protein [Acidobacteria bacterium AH-259-D05]
MEQVKRNWREALIDDQTRALLAFAEKITLEPASIRESDIEFLRGSGLSDEQILDGDLIAGNSNLTNRISSSLGVEPPEGVG